MCKITIFTATYNRASTLPRLYESLKKQTITDFEWLIVDDGSIDNTEEIVKNFLDENTINIRYIKQAENKGLTRALNRGIKEAKGELFYKVDSDDYLTANALERVLYYWEQVKNKPEFAGVAGLRGYDEQTVIGNNPNDEFIDATALEYRYKYKITGDRAEVLLTDILKKYPFPEIEGEKFVTEAVVWFRIANDGYKIRWFNEIIYITEEYRNDGLTKNIEKVLLENPKGCCLAYNEFSSYRIIPLNDKITFKSRYIKYGIIGKNGITKMFKESKNKLLFIISLPIGILRFTKFYKKKS